MATVATTLSGHSISTYSDTFVAGKHVRHYGLNGRTEAQVIAAAADLESEMALSNVVLGGAEPDIVMLQATEMSTMVVR